VDDVIVEAMKERDDSSLDVLLNHVAVLIGDSDRGSSLIRHYYEQYLTYSPENPRALYGLADVAMKAGQIENAKTHAKRCYEALLKTDDQKARKDLLDLILERWPEVDR
jgi:Tfp pilus assembly protein PilF